MRTRRTRCPAQQGDAEHEGALGSEHRFGVYEVHGEHAGDDQPGEPSEPDSAPASSIGALAVMGASRAMNSPAIVMPLLSQVEAVPESVKTPSLVR